MAKLTKDILVRNRQDILVMKFCKKVVHKVVKIARMAFAPYIVLDDFGTVQCEWTLEGAMSWLPVTSAHTMILHRWHGALVASRITGGSFDNQD